MNFLLKKQKRGTQRFLPIGRSVGAYHRRFSLQLRFDFAGENRYPWAVRGGEK